MWSALPDATRSSSRFTSLCAIWAVAACIGVRKVDERSGWCHGGGRPLCSRRCSTVEQAQHETSAHQECPDCHALAADLEAHKRWHERLVHDIATAVDRDMKRRVGVR